MKDYAKPIVETYGSVEEISESSNDGSYGGSGDDEGVNGAKWFK
ncbi:hypothetical protein [Halorubrum sp. N11]